MKPFKVGILGATGLVGQNLIRRLTGHPWFELAVLAASDRSAGKRFAEAVSWRLAAAPPGDIPDRIVRRCSPTELDECDLVFSALDSPVASKLEPAFAAAGFAVVSNSSAFRQADDVPLLVPEINAEHLGLVQRQTAGAQRGFIVTNPNCSITGLAVGVAPLHREFGVRRIVVTTMQAISGAGAEGPRAFDLTDNVVPYIAGEEDKMELELTRLLGQFRDGEVLRADVVVSAHCHRVPVIDGHLEAVSVELEDPADPSRVARAMREFKGDLASLNLPTAPRSPILVVDEPDRPQPRLDRDAGDGMSVTVGRIRACPVLGIKFELLSHNAVRGAAGGTLLNAELLAARGLLPRRSSA